MTGKLNKCILEISLPCNLTFINLSQILREYGLSDTVGFLQEVSVVRSFTIVVKKGNTEIYLWIWSQ